MELIKMLQTLVNSKGEPEKFFTIIRPASHLRKTQPSLPKNALLPCFLDQTSAPSDTQSDTFFSKVTLPRALQPDTPCAIMIQTKMANSLCHKELAQWKNHL